MGRRRNLSRTEPRRSGRYLKHRKTVAGAQRRSGRDTPPRQFRQSCSHRHTAGNGQDPGRIKNIAFHIQRRTHLDSMMMNSGSDVKYADEAGSITPGVSSAARIIKQKKQKAKIRQSHSGSAPRPGRASNFAATPRLGPQRDREHRAVGQDLSLGQPSASIGVLHPGVVML
jgi:hypothetical protein